MSGTNGTGATGAASSGSSTDPIAGLQEVFKEAIKETTDITRISTKGKVDIDAASQRPKN